MSKYLEKILKIINILINIIKTYFTFIISITGLIYACLTLYIYYFYNTADDYSIPEFDIVEIKYSNEHHNLPFRKRTMAFTNNFIAFSDDISGDRDIQMYENLQNKTNELKEAIKMKNYYKAGKLQDELDLIQNIENYNFDHNLFFEKIYTTIIEFPDNLDEYITSEDNGYITFEFPELYDNYGFNKYTIKNKEGLLKKIKDPVLYGSKYWKKQSNLLIIVFIFCYFIFFLIAIIKYKNNINRFIYLICISIILYTKYTFAKVCLICDYPYWEYYSVIDTSGSIIFNKYHYELENDYKRISLNKYKNSLYSLFILKLFIVFLIIINRHVLKKYNSIPKIFCKDYFIFMVLIYYTIYNILLLNNNEQNNRLNILYMILNAFLILITTPYLFYKNNIFKLIAFLILVMFIYISYINYNYKYKDNTKDKNIKYYNIFRFNILYFIVCIIINIIFKC